MGERGGLGGVGFLPPLHQQRVRGILNFLDLDLFIVHSHGGQGTGHLLLRAVGTEPSAKPPQGPQSLSVPLPNFPAPSQAQIGPSASTLTPNCNRGSDQVGKALQDD